MRAVTLLLVHAAATCSLAGLCWVVQLVVYPSFLLVGPSPAWPAFHAAHTRHLAAVVTLPWAVQGGSLAVLLLRDGPSVLRALTSLAALATVLVTVKVSVPLHTRLSSYDEAAATRLVRTNWWRTAAWTVGAVCSLLLVFRG